MNNFIARKICEKGEGHTYTGKYFNIEIAKEIITFTSNKDSSVRIMFKLNCFNSFIGRFSAFYFINDENEKQKYAPEKRLIKQCKSDLNRILLRMAFHKV